jgi:phosphatidylglycerophosphate synthase
MEPTAAMKSSASSPPGRPEEIEGVTNRWLIHPVSRALVGLLVATPITPNMVSMASVFAAAGAAAAFVLAPWPWAAPAGLACQFAWHVLDGADGDLARRTGRASAIGELVDGICDHASWGLIYAALGWKLSLAMGPWAWALMTAAGVSHFVQANAYETARKTYRRWVYGAAWMAQDASWAKGPIRRLLGGLYLAVSGVTSAGEDKVEAAMAPRLANQHQADAGRSLYRKRLIPLVKAAGWMSANARSIAAALAILAGSPLWFFLYEITVLNVLLAAIAIWRVRRNAAVAAELAGLADAA